MTKEEVQDVAHKSGVTPVTQELTDFQRIASVADGVLTLLNTLGDVNHIAAALGLINVHMNYNIAVSIGNAVKARQEAMVAASALSLPA